MTPGQGEEGGGGADVGVEPPAAGLGFGVLAPLLHLAALVQSRNRMGLVGADAPAESAPGVRAGP